MKGISLEWIMGGTFLVASLLVGRGTSGSPENTDKVLNDLDRAWGGAIAKRDWKALEDILANDFIAVGDQGQILNKSQDIDQLKKSQPGQNSTYEPSEYVVLVLDPAAAVMVHRATSTSVTDGRQSSETHRSLHVFVRRGGRWQVIATSQTPIP